MLTPQVTGIALQTIPGINTDSITMKSQGHPKLHSLHSQSIILGTLLLIVTIVPVKIVFDSSPLLQRLANLIPSLIPFTHLHPLAAVAAAYLISIAAIQFIYSSTKNIYLIDFSCYRPPDHCRVPLSTYIEHFNICPGFDESSIDFQTKLLERSGLGNETSLPVATHQLPPIQSLQVAQLEVETIMLTTIHDLLSKHQIEPTTIDILITSCGVFCPTPSISATAINHFGFRNDVRSFHLSGMGCSISLKSISLARDLLRVHKNSLALVISVETTNGGYEGKVKSMLVANCLFRMGGVAILLSNRKQDKPKARYLLQHAVCKHMGSDDTSYRSITFDCDKEGLTGVRLSKSILQVAGEALKSNISSLGPLVLPYTELLRYGWWVLFRKFQAGIYVPDFRKAFEHFCIHAGGKGVIDVVGEVLQLSDGDVEASRMTLYRFGNTSSATVWYSLLYTEVKGRMKRGDRVWQIAFGSGFKCNSVVWKCISETGPLAQNAWSDSIHRYPVDASKDLNH